MPDTAPPPATEQNQNQRIGCGFCLQTLDSNDIDPGGRALVKCPRCDRFFHEKCAPEFCDTPGCRDKNLGPARYAGTLRPARLNASRLQPLVPSSDLDFAEPRNLPLPVVAAGVILILLSGFLDPVQMAVDFLLGVLLFLIHRELRHPDESLATYEHLCAARIRQAARQYRELAKPAIIEAVVVIVACLSAPRMIFPAFGAMALGVGLWSLALFRRPIEVLERWLRPGPETPAEKVRSWFSKPERACRFAIAGLAAALLLLVQSIKLETRFGWSLSPWVAFAAICILTAVAWGAIGVTYEDQPGKLQRLTATISALALCLGILATAVILGQRLNWQLLSRSGEWSDSSWDLLIPGGIATFLFWRSFAVSESTRNLDSADHAAGNPRGNASVLLVLVALSAQYVITADRRQNFYAAGLVLVAAMAIISVKLFFQHVRASHFEKFVPPWAALETAAATSLLLITCLTFLFLGPGLILAVLLSACVFSWTSR